MCPGCCSAAAKRRENGSRSPPFRGSGVGRRPRRGARCGRGPSGLAGRTGKGPQELPERPSPAPHGVPRLHHSSACAPTDGRARPPGVCALVLPAGIALVETGQPEEFGLGHPVERDARLEGQQATTPLIPDSAATMTTRRRPELLGDRPMAHLPGRFAARAAASRAREALASRTPPASTHLRAPRPHSAPTSACPGREP